MHSRRIGNVAISALIADLLVCAAQAQYRPAVPAQKCIQDGDPVPGMPGVTFVYVYPPHIDGAGNVLAPAWMVGPGITSDNDGALWFGQPGQMTIVARDGDQAADMDPGVLYDDVTPGQEVSETGCIVFTAYLRGAGIVPHVNDVAVFCGPPGDFRCIKQAGDPVPEIGPDVVITATDWLGAGISDNGTVAVGGGVEGTGVGPTCHRAYWIGPPDSLQLIEWDGMPVPGCPDCAPGVTLLCTDLGSFNDAGQEAFRGILTGPGIYVANDVGRWIGPPGGLEIQDRDGDPTPQFGEGVALRCGCGILNAMNQYGDRINRLQLCGYRITRANDWVLVIETPEPYRVVAREGDLTPEAQSGTYVEGIENAFINNRREILYEVGFGDSTPGSGVYSGFGVYFGPYPGPCGGPRLIMESGRPAPYFPVGQVFRDVQNAGHVAMNDEGDVVTGSQAGPPTGSDGLSDVLWLWHHDVGHWTPILWSGMQIGTRTVVRDQYGFLCYYDWLTGGADGIGCSFNDARQMVVQTHFTDGTDGIYRLGPPLLGDTDGDGQVTAVELEQFAACAGAPGGEPPPGCEPLDLNLDGTVDLGDFRTLQLLVGEAR